MNQQSSIPTPPPLFSIKNTSCKKADSTFFGQINLQKKPKSSLKSDATKCRKLTVAFDENEMSLNDQLILLSPNRQSSQFESREPSPDSKSANKPEEWSCVCGQGYKYSKNLNQHIRKGCKLLELSKEFHKLINDLEKNSNSISSVQMAQTLKQIIAKHITVQHHTNNFSDVQSFNTRASNQLELQSNISSPSSLRNSLFSQSVTAQRPPYEEFKGEASQYGNRTQTKTVLNPAAALQQFSPPLQVSTRVAVLQIVHSKEQSRQSRKSVGTQAVLQDIIIKASTDGQRPLHHDQRSPPNQNHQSTLHNEMHQRESDIVMIDTSTKHKSRHEERSKAQSNSPPKLQSLQHTNEPISELELIWKDPPIKPKHKRVVAQPKVTSQLDLKMKSQAYLSFQSEYYRDVLMRDIDIETVKTFNKFYNDAPTRIKGPYNHLPKTLNESTIRSHHCALPRSVPARVLPTMTIDGSTPSSKKTIEGYGIIRFLLERMSNKENQILNSDQAFIPELKDLPYVLSMQRCLNEWHNQYPTPDKSTTAVAELQKFNSKIETTIVKRNILDERFQLLKSVSNDEHSIRVHKPLLPPLRCAFDMVENHRDHGVSSHREAKDAIWHQKLLRLDALVEELILLQAKSDYIVENDKNYDMQPRHHGQHLLCSGRNIEWRKNLHQQYTLQACTPLCRLYPFAYKALKQIDNEMTDIRIKIQDTKKELLRKVTTRWNYIPSKHALRVLEINMPDSHQWTYDDSIKRFKRFKPRQVPCKNENGKGRQCEHDKEDEEHEEEDDGMELDLEEDEAVTQKKRQRKISRKEKDMDKYYKLLPLIPEFKDNLQLGVNDRVEERKQRFQGIAYTGIDSRFPYWMVSGKEENYEENDDEKYERALSTRKPLQDVETVKIDRVTHRSLVNEFLQNLESTRQVIRKRTASLQRQFTSMPRPQFKPTFMKMITNWRKSLENYRRTIVSSLVPHTCQCGVEHIKCKHRVQIENSTKRLLSKRSRTITLVKHHVDKKNLSLSDSRRMIDKASVVSTFVRMCLECMNSITDTYITVMRTNDEHRIGALNISIRELARKLRKINEPAPKTKAMRKGVSVRVTSVKRSYVDTEKRVRAQLSFLAKTRESLIQINTADEVIMCKYRDSVHYGEFEDAWQIVEYQKQKTTMRLEIEEKLGMKPKDLDRQVYIVITQDSEQLFEIPRLMQSTTPAFEMIEDQQPLQDSSQIHEDNAPQIEQLPFESHLIKPKRYQSVNPVKTARVKFQHYRVIDKMDLHYERLSQQYFMLRDKGTLGKLIKNKRTNRTCKANKAPCKNGAQRVVLRFFQKPPTLEQLLEQV